MSSELIDDACNRRLLAVAEDQLTGFYTHPFDELARRCNMSAEQVVSRVNDMLRSGVIRSIRQTLPATQLTPSCLTAWLVPQHSLHAAFDWLVKNDPFTGHVVLREPENESHPSAPFRLWTTLRLPVDSPNGVQEHCRLLARHIDAHYFVCMPVVGMFRLSVGHMRRAGLPPGTLDDALPRMHKPILPRLSPQQQLVLDSLRAPLSREDINRSPWEPRAAALGMSLQDFSRLAEQLVRKGVLGRFAVILNHRDPVARQAAGVAEAALLMWAVPPGMEEQTGSICARHVCVTHCYFRSGSAPIGGAQIMGMVHGASREAVRAHKAAIDSALSSAHIPLLHSQMLWTQRACVRPSEQNSSLYRDWLNRFAE